MSSEISKNNNNNYITMNLLLYILCILSDINSRIMDMLAKSFRGSYQIMYNCKLKKEIPPDHERYINHDRV